MEELKKILFWTVTPQKTSASEEVETFYFTNDAAAREFLVSDHFQKEYGQNGSIKANEFNIFDTAQGLIDHTVKKLRDAGLSKLTEKEKRALGLV